MTKYKRKKRKASLFLFGNSARVIKNITIKLPRMK
jgi:hypothetical protein